VFDETNGSQVEQIDLDELDDEEAPCVALKGKCALGPFLSILVIECKHKVLKCESMPMDGQVANHK
jgi:hypothetical protein